MHRLRTAAVTAAATTALLLAPATAFAQPADTASGSDSDHGRLSISYNADPLRDLQPTVASPFDGASALVVMLGFRHSSYFTLRVRGIDPAAAGSTYGAHLHTGPCIAGDPAAAGPHYNTDALAGDPTPVASPRTEVWLDFEVNSRGRGHSDTVVPFRPEPGVRAIVIHEQPTDESNGVAGARVACLPLTIR